MLLQAYDPLGAHALEEHKSSSITLSPLTYGDQDTGSRDNVTNAFVHCSCGGAGVRRPESAIGDYIDAVYWRTDDDPFTPSMRRIDDDRSYGLHNSSTFRRKGVQVHYTVDFFTPTEARETTPTKKAARKGLWPYRAKY